MRRTHIIVGVLLIAAVLVLSGCMTTFSSDSGQLAYGEIEGTEQGRIQTDQGFMYILHPTLIPLTDEYWENVDLLIDPELQALEANAVQDLQIRYGFTAVDYVLSVFVPLLNWGTIEVEGNAVSQ